MTLTLRAWPVSLCREYLVGAGIRSWKGTAFQRGLQHGGRGIDIVKIRYQETVNEDTEG
jgi:hypothetical protein